MIISRKRFEQEIEKGRLEVYKEIDRENEMRVIYKRLENLEQELCRLRPAMVARPRQEPPKEADNG